MIKRYLFHNYNFILKQYRKLRRRMEKNLQNSSTYTITKKFSDLRKLKSLGEKLVALKPSFKPLVVAGFIALGASITPAFAQGPFVKQTGLDNPFEGVENDVYFVPRFVDLDNDGDLDLVIGGYGYYTSSFLYYKNTGTATNPVYTKQTGDDNPFKDLGSQYSYDYYAPTFGDLDGDGDFDMVLGEDSDRLRYFKNTGTSTAPVFQEQTDEDNPLSSFTNLGDELVPYLVDIDNDGDLDLFVGEEDDTQVYFFKNTGTTTAPTFEKLEGNDNPINNFEGLLSVDSYRAMPSFADVDGDGDFDAIIGYRNRDSYLGELAYLKNTGTKTNPVFTLQTGSENPFDEFEFSGGYVTPEFADVDGDGDLDLLAGLGWNSPTLMYFKNTQQVTGVAAKSISKDLNVYPNPADGSINLTIKNNIIGNCEVIMKTIDGLEISRVSISKTSNDFSLPMNVESLNSGIYIIEIINNNNVGIVKFVKN